MTRDINTATKGEAVSPLVVNAFIRNIWVLFHVLRIALSCLGDYMSGTLGMLLVIVFWTLDIIGHSVPICTLNLSPNKQKEIHVQEQALQRW